MNIILLKNSLFFICVVMCFYGQFSVAASTVSSQKENLSPVTVADTITMTRLVDPDVALAPFLGLEFNYSPDKEHFIIVTRRGNLATDKNEYRLILYRSQDVRDFLSQNGDGRHKIPRPSGKILSIVSTPSNVGTARQHGVRNVTWLADNKTLAFIGDTGTAPGQVFTIDIKSGKVQKLTQHPRSVMAFKIHASPNGLLYLAKEEVHDPDWAKTSFVVGTKSLMELANPTKEISSEKYFRFYWKPLDDDKSARGVGEVFPAFSPPKFWLSPDAKWIMTFMSQEKAPPRSWLEKYPPLKSSLPLKLAIENFDDLVMKPSLLLFPQFFLTNIITGERDIVFDAPTGFLLGHADPAALWLPDGEHVILTNIFRPVTAPPKAGAKITPEIVEYNVHTKRAVPVTTLSGPDTPGKGRFTNILYGDESLTVEYRMPDRTLLSERYAKRKGGWQRLDRKGLETAEGPSWPLDLRLSIEEDLTKAPNLHAKNDRTGQEKTITDLNPQLRGLQFGPAAEYYWTDRDGRQWRGGLIYPPGHERGKRYPLVIQYGYFFPGKFLIDGPVPTGAYAAQALAGKGMMVLQMQQPLDVMGQAAELDAYRAGTEAVIDKLHGEKLIDRKRVGLVGFSRSGLYVEHMLLFSDYEIVAATIADGATLNISTFLLLYGMRPPGLAQMEKMIDNLKPWADQFSAWKDRISTLNLGNITTPLRFERYLDNMNYNFSYWDAYVFLRRMHKPVELMIFPKSDHNMISPRERLEQNHIK